MIGQLRRNGPAISLFLLAPAVGELLSGSSPPVEFLNPLLLLIIACLYGGGALLVRDAVRRWRKGYPSLLCLAAAYGIFEEGIVCKSFFDPGWPDLGMLGTYGRWLGTNWVWAVWLTLYHSIVSIAVPILLVEVIFPARRTDQWLGRGWQVALLAVMGFEAFIGYFGISDFRPPWLHYGVTWAVVLALIPVAKRLPPRVGWLRGVTPRNRPAAFWWVGFLWILLSFVVFFALPGTRLPPIGTVFVGLMMAAAAGWLLLRASGNMDAWDDRGRFLFGAGVLSFFVILAPLQQLDKERPDDTTGMALVGLAFLLLLLWQGRRVWART